MKKIVCMAAALFAALTLSAGPVSPEKALQVAGKFFGDQDGTRSSSLSIVWTGNENTARRAVEEPAFYAINRSDGGWIIVAGDDNARPVLGFSKSGQFVAEGMPEHVSEWMKGLKLYCRQAAAGAAREEIAILWDAFDPATRGSKITAAVTDEYTASQTLEWGQNGYNSLEHFNIYCPWDESAGARSVTGCLPLAVAEIAAWQSLHGFDVPTSGTGIVGGYEVPAGYYAPTTYNLSTSTYQWDLFNTRDARYMYYSATDEVKQAVSRVIADFGAALNAQYSAGGTGASNGDVIKAFGDHFRYNKAAHLEHADVYSLRIWKNMLKAQVEVTPLLYAGQSPSAGGHAFVLDGYARYLDDDVFHFNFGWFGQNNGYYILPDLDTSAGSDGSQNWAYARPVALFDFVPDPAGTSEYASTVLAFFNNGDVEGGLSVVGPMQIRQNDPFSVTIKSISSEGPALFNGYLCIALYDKDGIFKEPLVYGNLTNLPPGGFVSGFDMPVEIYSELEFGDYLGACYLPNTVDPEEWSSYVPVKASTTGQVLAKYPVFGAAFIDTSDSPSYGDTFNLRLVNAPYAYNGLNYTTTWTITRPDGTQVVVPQDEGIVTLNAHGTFHLKAKVVRRSDSSVLETIETDLVVE